MTFQLATCVGCGCDDDHACILHGGEFGKAPCMWVRLDRASGVGVCSNPNCAPYIERWDAAGSAPQLHSKIARAIAGGKP